ncbi:MAG: helix-turn-helix transcriptional regulator [Anaeromyxobacteraceae bacterium]
MTQGESLYSNAVVDPLDVGSYGRPSAGEPLARVFLTAMTTFNLTPGVLSGFERYLPQSTTVVVERRSSRFFAAHLSDSVPTADRIRDILRYLGLSKTQLKDACRVSRQTLYDWLEGRFEPEAANAARLKEIHALALTVAAAGTPLSARIVQSPLPDGRTLALALAESAPHFEELKGFVTTLASVSAAKKSRSAKSLLERLGGTPPSEHSQDATLDDNLSKIG